MMNLVDTHKPVMRISLLGAFTLCITLTNEVCYSDSKPASVTLSGEKLFLQHGCGGCHRLDRLSSAQGRVGPALNAFARRNYISGILPNSQENLANWLLNPQAYHPDSAMPDLSLTSAQAKAIAEYLWHD